MDESFEYVDYSSHCFDGDVDVKLAFAEERPYEEFQLNDSSRIEQQKSEENVQAVRSERDMIQPLLDIPALNKIQKQSRLFRNLVLRRKRIQTKASVEDKTWGNTSWNVKLLHWERDRKMKAVKELKETLKKLKGKKKQHKLQATQIIAATDEAKQLIRESQERFESYKVKQN